ncbi:MAG: lipopolysaccharide biosynthesis protein [Solirubrobacteraceae bacterium]
MSAPATDSPAARVRALLGDARDPGRRGELIAGLRNSDTGKAAGLAGAMIANNVIALASTVVFARELTDYGSLGALISYLLILTVAGQAMQVATAREGVLGHLGIGDRLVATTRAWTRSMLAVTLLLTVASVLLRQPIADAVGVKHYPWAAAFGIPAGCLYLEISLLRGALQGVGDYKSVGLSLVGEQGARLFTGAILAIGLNVTGAYIGSLLSYIAVAVYCFVQLDRYAAKARTHAVLGADATPAEAVEPAISLWNHVKRAWAPIAGLVVIAVLQNIDIIAAKHRFDSKTATSYAAVAVAAKVLIWVAIGAGFYLVPEVSRRRAEGLETRSVLVKALGIVLVCAIPCLLIFVGVPHQLIKTAFTAKKATASSSLPVLGLAFTVLACTYLAIQYMLALKRTWFLALVGLVAVAEPIALLNASKHPTSFAAVVLAVQGAAALVAFACALRSDRVEPANAGSSGSSPAGVPPRISQMSPPGTRLPALQPNADA